jgi:hypothetical protein
MSYENKVKYYVYAYLRADGTPYYIGKGQGKRAWTKGKGEVYPPVDKSLVKIIAHKLWENEAFALEEKLILQYGRKDLGTGILRNQSNGGEGTKKPYNKIAWNKGLTKEDPRVAKNAQNISKALKNYTRTEEHQQNINKSLQGREPTWTGRTHTEETKAKLRALYLGKKREPMSPESKAKLSQTMKQVRATKHWSPKGITV